MSNGKTYVTVQGNVVADPETRTTKSGAPFASMRIAVTPRTYLREQDAWVDAETSYYRVAAFNGLGINVLNCVRKGQPVVVYGTLAIREWATDDGEPRKDPQLTAEVVGHSMRWGRSEFTKDSRPTLDAVSDQAPPVEAERSFGSDEQPAERASGPLVPTEGSHEPAYVVTT